MYGRNLKISPNFNDCHPFCGIKLPGYGTLTIRGMMDESTIYTREGYSDNVLDYNAWGGTGGFFRNQNNIYELMEVGYKLTNFGLSIFDYFNFNFFDIYNMLFTESEAIDKKAKTLEREQDEIIDEEDRNEEVRDTTVTIWHTEERTRLGGTTRYGETRTIPIKEFEEFIKDYPRTIIEITIPDK